MLEDTEEILETMKKRELDIDTLQLQLKHNLTKKRVESKLLIMYYKVCNAISRTKLIMHGINGQDMKSLQPPSPVDPWNDHQRKRF
jgi:hypothetical protein